MNINFPGARRIFFIVTLLLFGRSGAADSMVAFANEVESPSRPVRIALIIDDLGDVLKSGQRAAALDGPVACAVLPYTRFGERIAKQAHVAGKEVMLHLPLQAVEQLVITNSGTIDIDVTRAQLIRIFKGDMNSVPHVVGINNHMGSLLTQHPGHMRWLMSAVKAHGDLFFVDSYTTSASIVMQVARERGVPAIRRDVFLDVDPNPAAIHREFERLKKRALKNGIAIGIGHPHAETLQYLEQALPGLRNEGIELVPVGSLIRPTDG
jgi:polysaccharide deacetylase 2 family uncharacterized protein YibQ